MDASSDLLFRDIRGTEKELYDATGRNCSDAKVDQILEGVENHGKKCVTHDGESSSGFAMALASSLMNASGITTLPSSQPTEALLPQEMPATESSPSEISLQSSKLTMQSLTSGKNT